MDKEEKEKIDDVFRAIGTKELLDVAFGSSPIRILTDAMRAQKISIWMGH